MKDERRITIAPLGKPGGTQRFRSSVLLGGAESLKIHGRMVPIRAEVAKMDGLSAHTDRDGLLGWLKAMDGRPRGVLLVHGDEPALESLGAAIEADLRLEARIPSYRESVDLA